MSNLESCFELLKARVEDMGINPQTLVVISRYAMEISEKTKLKGADKKELVLQLLTKLVNESSLEDLNKNACLALLDGGVVETTIELIVEASKGNIAFNKKSLLSLAKSCLLACIKAPRQHPSIQLTAAVTGAVHQDEVAPPPAAEEAAPAAEEAVPAAEEAAPAAEEAAPAAEEEAAAAAEEAAPAAEEEAAPAAESHE